MRGILIRSREGPLRRRWCDRTPINKPSGVPTCSSAGRWLRGAGRTASAVTVAVAALLHRAASLRRMGGDAPARAIHRSAGLSGIEGAETLASPWVIAGVCSSPALRASDKLLGRRGRAPIHCRPPSPSRHRNAAPFVSPPSFHHRPWPLPCPQPGGLERPSARREWSGGVGLSPRAHRGRVPPAVSPPRTRLRV